MQYDITRDQPVLFAGRSLAEVVDVVGGFLEVADDERVSALLRVQPGRPLASHG